MNTEPDAQVVPSDFPQEVLLARAEDRLKSQFDDLTLEQVAPMAQTAAAFLTLFVGLFCCYLVGAGFLQRQPWLQIVFAASLLVSGLGALWFGWMTYFMTQTLQSAYAQSLEDLQSMDFHRPAKVEPTPEAPHIHKIIKQERSKKRLTQQESVVYMTPRLHQN